MTHNDPRGPNDPANVQPMGSGGSQWMPIVLAIAVAVVLLWLFVPRNTTTAVNDTTNAGPSVQTVAPALSPSTSPAVPTPEPDD